MLTRRGPDSKRGSEGVKCSLYSEYTLGAIYILPGPLSQVLRLESNNIPGPVVGGPLECNFEEKTIALVDFFAFQVQSNCFP